MITQEQYTELQTTVNNLPLTPAQKERIKEMLTAWGYIAPMRRPARGEVWVNSDVKEIKDEIFLLITKDSDLASPTDCGEYICFIQAGWNTSVTPSWIFEGIYVLYAESLQQAMERYNREHWKDGKYASQHASQLTTQVKLV